MKYFLYARKSSESEDRQILSIEAQLRELRDLAEKEQLEIAASFEEAKTAKEPDKKIGSNWVLTAHTFFRFLKGEVHHFESFQISVDKND